MNEFSGPCGARFSECRRYRYELWRVWEPARPLLVFCGLNPSTADETIDDPTIRRCQGFARREGKGGIVMLNIFALRSTDPKKLLQVADPIGPDNDRTIEAWSGRASVHAMVGCWGNTPPGPSRAETLMSQYKLLDHIMCLGVTKDGQARHPLYLRNDTPLLLLREARSRR